ncbi:ribosome biogenesis GTP-binding protein YihA/YsxC [Rurimicrobium arvi]|uniref:Probable GTP-binding protein EngB n=1 Tax=Rurimicrobium arvi TaxID=2049916 RepID=A0ABP8MPF2_9BACT
MEIKSSKYLISNVNVNACPKPDKPEFAFIGRSNVGKSSLINMLTNNSKLAKTSGSPGKTQHINHFIINHNWYLVDLPGYGYAKVSQNKRREFGHMISDYLQKRENLICVFVLIDSRLKPQEIDLDFLRALGEWGIPFNIVFTKADKNTQSETSRNAKFFINKMREEWEYIPRSFITSSVKHLGRKDMLQYIGELIEQYENELTEQQ